MKKAPAKHTNANTDKWPTTTCWVGDRQWRIIICDGTVNKAFQKKRQRYQTITLGQADWSSREIHLNSELLEDEHQLLSTLIHEIMHTAIQATDLPERYDLNDDFIEALIESLDEIIGQALLTSGWVKLTIPSPKG